jgi:preprotein translocase subunit SecA
MNDIDYKVIKMLLSVDSIVPVTQPTIDESTLQMSQPAEILMPPGTMQEFSGADSSPSDGRDASGLRVTRITPTTPTAPATEYAGVGRNDACPCGSGKKFKHCHGR